MKIAITDIDSQDENDFNVFLKRERKTLPDLRYSSLAWPHSDIAIIYNKKLADKNVILDDIGLNGYNYNKYISIFSSTPPPLRLSNGKTYVFSGYIFYDNKFIIGQNDLYKMITPDSNIINLYGEYNLCILSDDTIQLSSDFFGMAPWFYYNDSEYFIATNHYHLLIKIIVQLSLAPQLNIKRSRVNLITSGFTYGVPFTTDLDVANCKISLAYEIIKYSSFEGVVCERSELWRIVSKDWKWNVYEYEKLINKARDEIINNCYAVFSSPYFEKVVVDISGGFDSRVVFAAANALPAYLRQKMYVYTRKTRNPDDFYKAQAIINMFNYSKYYYADQDTTLLYSENADELNVINLPHISRTLGLFSVNPHLYTANYNNHETVEITGYLGEVILGYMRCRGDLDYSLGDRRLLARLGGCYIYNNVEQLKEIFKDQEDIINKTLSNYSSCDCLFKKFQILYIDFRNRFICGSTRNIEHNNLRIPMCFSKYALMAKWMYFSKFNNNTIPDEKISLDLINALNPLLGCLPFESSNDKVISENNNLINKPSIEIKPDFSCRASENDIHNEAVNLSYRNQFLKLIDDIEVAEEMLLAIYDYSKDYYSACLGCYKLLTIIKKNPELCSFGHVRESLRKIYDIYYQIKLVQNSLN